MTVLSGGEKGRMIYGKLMLTRPNVMLMDEPTNHMDMETIESLQIGLEKYPGTLLFVISPAGQLRIATAGAAPGPSEADTTIWLGGGQAAGGSAPSASHPSR